MSWNPIINDADGKARVEYPSSYYWDINLNPLASPTNCLANCTTLAYGRIIQNDNDAPVSPVRNANLWHTNLINDWEAVLYELANIEVGDIIQWGDGTSSLGGKYSENHVAVVESIINGTIYVSGSFYTDASIRYSGTLQQINDYMWANYSYRTYHLRTLAQEIINGGHGHDPVYVLKNPSRPEPSFKTWLYTSIYSKIQGRKNKHVRIY